MLFIVSNEERVSGRIRSRLGGHGKQLLSSRLRLHLINQSRIVVPDTPSPALPTGHRVSVPFEDMERAIWSSSLVRNTQIPGNLLGVTFRTKRPHMAELYPHPPFFKKGGASQEDFILSLTISPRYF